ncbi:MAG: group I truncated hemoglobin [Deltaproteobacteria bacterium]
MRSSVRISVALALGLSACASHKPVPTPSAPPPAAAPEAPKSLYERLGGQPAVEAVVGEFLQNVAHDERINAPFGMANLGLLDKRLVQFVCAATGGPCKYEGKDMKAAHANMGVTGAQFDALVGDLVLALDKFHVPAREKGELLGALGPLKPQIVEVP